MRQGFDSDVVVNLVFARHQLLGGNVAFRTTSSLFMRTHARVAKKDHEPSQRSSIATLSADVRSGRTAQESVDRMN